MFLNHDTVIYTTTVVRFDNKLKIINRNHLRILLEKTLESDLDDTVSLYDVFKKT